MTTNGTPPGNPPNTKVDEQNLTWSRAYWAVLVNQLLVVGVVTFLAVGFLRESHRASQAANLELPKMIRWYFFFVGPAGLALAGLMSVAVSLAVVGLRRRIAAIVVTSTSFVACVIFLVGGIFSSYLPLLMWIRNWFPTDDRW